MNEGTGLDTKQHWFFGYKDYWAGNGIMVLLFSIIYSLSKANEVGLIFGILTSLIIAPVVFSSITGMILLIARIFKRDFNIQRFLTVLSIITFVSLLLNIVYFVQSSLLGG